MEQLPDSLVPVGNDLILLNKKPILLRKQNLVIGTLSVLSHVHAPGVRHVDGVIRHHVGSGINAVIDHHVRIAAAKHLSGPEKEPLKRQVITLAEDPGELIARNDAATTKT